MEWSLYKKSILGKGFDMDRMEIVEYRGSENFVFFDITIII